jgi:choline dehydrogenase-like flavoprotein
MVSLNDEAVVVIGSGAGGGTIAFELCRRGVDVVLLEAGKRIEPAEFVQDELGGYAQLSWLDPRVASGDWLAATYSPTAPAWTVKALGGATLHWNAIALRLQAHEFKPRTTYGAIDGADVIDWPLTLEELAPYYDRAESALGVTGTHGIAPHKPNNNYKVLWNGAKRIGYKEVRNDRLAINSAVRDGRPSCAQLGFCNQGCMISAKWSSAASEIAKAEATGKLDLRTSAHVLRIEHDSNGEASAVVYKDADGNEQRQKARIVVLAAGGVETPRLLLLSESSKFPQGLANGSGQVGRHFMRHVQSISFGAFPEKVNMHRGIVTPGIVYDESRHDPSRGFAGGYLMEAVALQPVGLALLLDPNGWGESYAGFLERFDHLAGILQVGEDLPRADNRITLDAAVRDANGQPVARIHVDDHATAHVMRKHFWAQSEALFKAVGADDVRHGQPFSATHTMGTARMSENPRDGVTNRYGQTHEVKNLFIADGSLLPSAGAENPTLTIVALAMRQAERIAQLMSRGTI